MVGCESQILSLQTKNGMKSNSGNLYEHIEYTPYGETFLDDVALNASYKNATYFTGKEKDEETGLNYFCARYMDGKSSRWLSSDPALDDYMNENKKGEGGIFNVTNANLYHYAGNNPIKYVDPNGEKILDIISKQYQNSSENKNVYIGSFPSGYFNSDGKYIRNTVGDFGCLFVSTVNVGNSYNKMTDSSEGYSEISVSSLASNDSYFSFFTVSEWNANYSGKDFASGPKEISKLLFDITGENFSVERYSGSETKSLE